MINKSVNLAIWDRLVRGESLQGLALPERNGRVDLRGLQLPSPEILQQLSVGHFGSDQFDLASAIHDVKWKGLDFSGSKLNGLRFFRCEIADCLFDSCRLQDIKVWTTAFVDCSFRGANLRGSSLGAVENGARNIYRDVDFSTADLRETVYQAAAFEKCIFRNARLVKIDFQGSTFKDCIFEGELQDVLFYRYGFRGEKFPPNEMINVNMSHAVLHAVDFRGLTLDSVKLPENVSHVVIKDVAKTLDKFAADLNQRKDPLAKELAEFLNISRQWIPVDQMQNVVNLQDLEQSLGADAVRLFLELIKKG